jgi:hypothetical protein
MLGLPRRLRRFFVITSCYHGSLSAVLVWSLALVVEVLSVDNDNRWYRTDNCG